MQEKSKYILSVFLAMFIFGSMGIFARLSNQNGLVITFFASLFAGGAFIILLCIRREPLQNVFTKYGLYLLAVGILGTANNALYFYAFTKTTIAQAVFLHNLAPIFAVLLAAIFLKESFTYKKTLAIFFSILGIFFVSELYASGLSGLSTGNALAILSAISLGILLPLYKKTLEYFGFATVLASQMLLSALLLAPLVLSQELTITTFQWSMLLTIGLVAQFLAVLLHVPPLKHLSTSTVALLGYLEPVFATLFAFIFFFETQTIMTLIGGSLILIGSYLAIET